MHDRTQCSPQAVEYFHTDSYSDGNAITLATTPADQHAAANLDAAADLDTTAVLYSIADLDAVDHADPIQYTCRYRNILADEYADPSHQDQYAKS